MRASLTLILTMSCICAASCALAALNPSPSVGLNKVDLAQQYLGKGAGADGGPEGVLMDLVLARKAIADAHKLGIHYFRVAITGYAPSVHGRPGDLDSWIKNPVQYWAAIDSMMEDLSRSDIQIIPTFVWNPVQFPSMAGETIGDKIFVRSF